METPLRVDLMRSTRPLAIIFIKIASCLTGKIDISIDYYFTTFEIMNLIHGCGAGVGHYVISGV